MQMIADVPVLFLLLIRILQYFQSANSSLRDISVSIFTNIHIKDDSINVLYVIILLNIKKPGMDGDFPQMTWGGFKNINFRTPLYSY